MSFKVNPNIEDIPENVIRNMLRYLQDPDFFSFSGGVPDPNLFPRESFAKTAQKTILKDGMSALQYGATEGTRALREVIAKRMCSSGVDCTYENIIVTGGAQQAIDLCVRTLKVPNKKVLVEDPTYLGALQILKSHAQDIGILSDKSVVKKDPVSFAYAVPNHANPTGVSMSIESRLRLLKQASEQDFAIIEDAAYNDLTYYGEVLPSLLSLDTASTGSVDRSRVFFCGTFSKTLAPGLRIGWVCAPKSAIELMAQLKECMDSGCSTINQRMIEDISGDLYDKHVEHIQNIYRIRLDSMHESLKNHMPRNVKWNKPKGGMFFWLELPKGTDAEDLLRYSIETVKVLFVPGHNFKILNSEKNFLRLSFCLYEPKIIDEGIRRLSKCIEEYLNIV